jgi:hypothetical protein
MKYRIDERNERGHVIAQRIKSLAGNLNSDRGIEQKRFCKYSDIDILKKEDASCTV